MKLCDILKKARYDMRLTLREAAIGIGISVSHLHAIETGAKPRPKMETIYKLADFYGLHIDEACISAERIPRDVFYKIIRNPGLLLVIRNLEV